MQVLRDNKQFVQLFWQTSQKDLIVYITTYLLLGWTHIVLIKEHYNLVIATRVRDHKQSKWVLHLARNWIFRAEFLKDQYFFNTI